MKNTTAIFALFLSFSTLSLAKDLKTLNEEMTEILKPSPQYDVLTNCGTYDAENAYQDKKNGEVLNLARVTEIGPKDDKKCFVLYQHAFSRRT